MTKPWYQSITIVFGIIFAAVQSAETMGVIPTGAGAELTKVFSGLGALYGLRRATG